MAIDSTPEEVQTDLGRVKMQRGRDAVEIARYNDAVAAASKKSRGLRFDKLILPGQVGSSSNPTED